MAWPHDRQHFRIQYPEKLRPVFDTGRQRFDVLDVSEGGLRLALPAGGPVEGDELAGSVAFRRGETLPVRGVVVRVGADHVALRLDVGIPYRTVLEEQRFLLANNYGLNW